MMMGLMRTIEGIRSPFLDAVIGLVTRLGEETVGVVVLCAIFWCISKRAAYGIGIAYFLSGLTVQGMKIGFRIDRPWIIDPALNPVPSALDHATGYSFPSGHTQSAATLFGSIGAQIKGRPVKVLCFFLAVLVAFSRVYLGVHTIQDVTASLLISFLLILLTLKVIYNDNPNKKRELIIAILMMAYAIAVAAFAIGLHAGGMIAQSYVSDCLKAAGAGIGFTAGMYIERVYIDFPVKAKKAPWQIMKFIIGISGVFAIKEGLKLVIGTGLAVDMIRYFIMLIWVTALFPLIIKRFLASGTATPK